jgi:hypothetical protein
LRPVRGGREAHPICDVGDGIAVRIDLELVALGANGSRVVDPGGFTTAEGWTFMIRIDLSASLGLGKAYKSVRSRRASPCGKPKSGPE